MKKNSRAKEQAPAKDTSSASTASNGGAYANSSCPAFLRVPAYGLPMPKSRGRSSSPKDQGSREQAKRLLAEHQAGAKAKVEEIFSTSHQKEQEELKKQARLAAEAKEILEALAADAARREEAMEVEAKNLSDERRSL